MKRSLVRLFSTHLILSASATLPIHTLALAEESETLEPVVVTASRVATPQSEVAQSITVIEPTESDRQSGRLVYDLLRTVPGVMVMNNGGPAQTATVFIRGASSEHTLVLIDGVSVNDPTSPGRGFDFSGLTTAEIDRIEVVRGSQSGVHGTNAIGGVIHIITKRATTQGPQASIRADYGAFNTSRLSGRVSSTTESTKFLGSASYESSDGFPAAGTQYGNTLNNGHQRLVGVLSLDTKLTDSTSAEFTARAQNLRADIPRNGGVNGEDPNNTTDDSLGAFGLTLKHRGLDWIEPSIRITGNFMVRRSENLPDTVEPSSSLFFSQGNRIRAEQINQIDLGEFNSASFGLDIQRERSITSDSYNSGKFDESQNVFGIFVENQTRIDSFFLSSAARVDRFQNRSAELTYRVGPGYKIQSTNTVIKSSIGRGFRVPSLYQLNAPGIGNPGLLPERSFSVDATAEQSWNRLRGSISVFQTQLTNQIDWQDTGYFNVSKSSMRGAELSLAAQATEKLDFQVDYHYLFARNDSDQKLLARRPRNALSMSASWVPTPSLSVRLNGRYVGERFDNPSNSVRMPSYTVFNADASYSIGDGYKAFGRLDNLLDREYEEVAGYGTARRSVYFGLQKEI